MDTLSKQEARNLLIHYHNIDRSEELAGIDGARKIMDRIESIQYDPLNVVGRNADLALRARVKDYRPQYLQTLLYGEHTLVDGYDKEMCIYNTRDFGKFSYVRKEHIEQYTVLTLAYRNQMGALDILDEVRSFIQEHGVTGTKDLSIGEVRESTWGHKKLSSAALDYLFNNGELCVVDKRGTQKYFDLTERVIPEDILVGADEMTIDEFLDWYVERRLCSVGFIWNKPGGSWQGHYLSKKDIRTSVLQRLLEQEKIVAFRIAGINNEFYASRDILKYMDYTKPQDYARFIAPLDNIMWDRTLIEKLFDFEYRWEVYMPVAKRVYGYYVLPVIYNGRFVARFEPEPVGQTGEFIIKNWWWEKDVTPDERMNAAIDREKNDITRSLGLA